MKRSNDILNCQWTAHVQSVEFSPLTFLNLVKECFYWYPIFILKGTNHRSRKKNRCANSQSCNSRQNFLKPSEGVFICALFNIFFWNHLKEHSYIVNQVATSDPNVFFLVTDLQGKPKFLFPLLVISCYLAVLDLYHTMPPRQF